MPINIVIDTSEANAMAGFLQEISLKIGTPQYIGPVLDWTHAKMSEAFTEHMSAVAQAAPQRFHHVYDWGQNAVGDPEKQLWQDVLVGRGNAKIASFVWKASTQTVPVRPDFAEMGVQQVHIFTWKAPVMEYDTNIRINPTDGAGLAYFTGPTNPQYKWDMKFTSRPIMVQYPGGREVKGSFTREYVAWWAGEGASGIFSSSIRALLERDLADMPLGTTSGMFRAGVASKTKTFKIDALADAEAAIRMGRESARIWLEARNKRYIEGAKARRAIIYGGENG